MRDVCIQAVQTAAGRSITAGEARDIEQRVRDGMLAVARQDPTAWQALSAADRLRAGAQHAANELVQEAAKKKQRIALTILAHDRIESYVRDQMAGGYDQSDLDALSRLIASQPDGKNHSGSVESEARGIMAQTMGRLTDAWEAIKPGMLGFLANRAAEDQFMRALHGDTQGVRPEIAKAVTVWQDATEALRQRFNAAGGVIGKLDNWGMPHAWSQDIAVKLGKARFVDDMMRWVDRRQYVHEDGNAYSDGEMRDFLGEAWTTIATNGANKPIQIGHPGGSIKANRGNQARQIHFRDGAASLAALRAYSGHNVFETMVGHARKLSRDIALIETLGPNADLAAQHFIDRYTMEAANADPTHAAATEKKAAYVAHLYDSVAGNSEPPPNRRLAAAASMVRAWMSASKLGSATITALSDPGSLYLTARANHLPMFKLFLNHLRTLNPLDREEARFAQRAGLLMHTMADEVNRFGDDTLGSHIPTKISAAVMRASGLNAWTEASRRAFGVTMMDTIGSLTRRFDSLAKLDPNDWKLLRDKGISDEEWAVWRAAKPDHWRGNDTVLTPERIYQVSDADLARIAPGVAPAVLRERAASKLLAAVLDEQDIAVIEPGARERALLHRGTQRGTPMGELARTFWQFKTFPVSMMTRHWKRGMGLYSTTGGKAGYLATLIASQTILGAIAMETNDILSGKNPRSLNPASEHGGRNWLAAVLKGGSLGLYGDFLFNDNTQYGQSILGAAAGPVAGFVEDLDSLTRKNIIQAMHGERTDAGAEFTRFVRSYTPGSSLWYVKAALDRLVFHQMQEYFSPGYLARAKSKARRDYGTTYWWDPGKPPGQAKPVEVASAWQK